MAFWRWKVISSASSGCKYNMKRIEKKVEKRRLFYAQGLKVKKKLFLKLRSANLRFFIQHSIRPLLLTFIQIERKIQRNVLSTLNTFTHKQEKHCFHTCASMCLSHYQSVGDVFPCRLRGPSYLHHPTSSETKMPCDGIQRGHPRQLCLTEPKRPQQILFFYIRQRDVGRD